MTEIWQNFRDWLARPDVQSALLFLGLALLVLLFIWLMIRAFRRPRRQIEDEFQMIANNQNALAGRMDQMVKYQTESINQLAQFVEKRFDFAQKQMDDTLGKTASGTAQSIGALMARLEAIDKAQNNIEKLSGDVLGLQNILANKQTRGAFGEIQLYDLLQNALPKDSYVTQATLSTSARVDCLVKLPKPPGPIAIDSKFPLEAYEALRRAETEAEKTAARTFFRNSMRKHIKDISEKYIIEGETAEGAILFLPSEAVYAELHANFPEIVREGFERRVWIVSPTTCMATLTTMRAVMKDVRLREQAGQIRTELAVLVKDIDRLSERVLNLDRHFGQAQKDVESIKISTQKVSTRSSKLESLEFEEDNAPKILSEAPIAKSQNG